MDNLRVHEDFPDFLRRCDHCGQPATGADPLTSYDWKGRPDGVRLHQRCEEHWFDSFRPARSNGGATEKQPDAVADVPDQAEKAPPAADVIEEQLRDHEARMAAAKAAKQEADQRATVAAQLQASLVLEAIVPDVVVPAQRPIAPRRPSSSGNPRPQSRGAVAGSMPRLRRGSAELGARRRRRSRNGSSPSFAA
jgi:hypothetical protein